MFPFSGDGNGLISEGIFGVSGIFIESSVINVNSVGMILSPSNLKFLSKLLFNIFILLFGINLLPSITKFLHSVIEDPFGSLNIIYQLLIVILLIFLIFKIPLYLFLLFLTNSTLKLTRFTLLLDIFYY